MAQRPFPPAVAALAQKTFDRIRSKRRGRGTLQMPLNAAESSEALTQWLVNLALSGFGPMQSAQSIADRYLCDPKLTSDAQRLDSLVRHESQKSFGAGFLTSLPLPLTLPAMLPLALVSAWIIQARMVAAMAIIMGHDRDSLWVRTTVLLALDDSRTPKALVDAGLDAGQWAAVGMAQHLAQPVLGALWQKASQALMRQVSRRPLTKMGRLVPLMGAMVAGGLDAYSCKEVAARGRSLIVPPDRQLT